MGRITTALSSVVRNGWYNLTHPSEWRPRRRVQELKQSPEFFRAAGKAGYRNTKDAARETGRKLRRK